MQRTKEHQANQGNYKHQTNFPFFSSKQLTWKFRFFKWQWGCKPVFIYTFVSSTDPPRPPCGAGQGTEWLRFFPARSNQVVERRSKTKGDFCEARPLVRLSLLLDPAKQTTSNAEKHMLRTFLMNTCILRPLTAHQPHIPPLLQSQVVEKAAELSTS